MLFDVVITPFQHLPDCSATDIHYGDFNCQTLYSKIISMRVYFVIILLNFIFIVTTTCYFIYRVLKAKWTNSDDISQDNISKHWQEYSLKKRGLFGSVLGAIGHFVFSTSVLFYQALLKPWTCDAYLWGPMLGFYTWTYAIIWRSVRLYVLIRLSNLQKRYLKTPLQTNDPRKHQNDNDYKWFIRQKDRLNINTSYHIYIYSTTIVILIVVIVLAETLSIRGYGAPRCSLDWGNNMIMSLVIFFFVVVVPAIGWLLKGYEDAHGIRREIWVTLLVGIPCFVCFMTWQFVFESPNLSTGSVRNLWGPGNWILFVTTTNHIMSIVLPTFNTLSIQHKSKTKSETIIEISIFGSPDVLISGSAIPSSSSSSPILRRNTLKLTTESLEENLCDPYMRGVLREWAIKDFSVENVLFYEFYLSLVQKVHRSITKDTLNKIKSKMPENKQPKNNHSLKMKERSLTYTPFSFDSASTLSQNDIFSIPTDDDLSTTFPLDAVPEFLNFYDTFIKENAPLQVNISHKARERIDQVFQPVELSLPRTPSQSSYLLNDDAMASTTNPTYLDMKLPPPSHQPFSETVSSSSITSSPEEEKHAMLDSPLHSNIDMSTLTSIRMSLELFEAARKEVFWNIFAGVYPKVVDAYS
ncbi:hypothetical protein K501DRAFT_314174 [Backusella circina FSU 941]|nr:hypothetical protein K501DRAFT_314174 [Backusella circina FSU 941]